MTSNIRINNDFVKAIDPKGKLDFTYLNELMPYRGDIKEYFRDINIEEEIEQLNEDICSIDISSIPFDKWDYIVAFTLALVEVAGDFFISDHNHKGSLANKMSDKNTKLGEYFDKIHKNLSHDNQPLDYQKGGTPFSGGDHRGKTVGHDVFFFWLGIAMLCLGEFIDLDPNTMKIVRDSWNWNGRNTGQTEYATMDLGEAMNAYTIHMFADFFSKTSLPIPGFSFLTHFPNEKVREFANELYKDGLNMRNLMMQGVPVAITELITWVYTSLRYKDSTYSKEAIKNKKEKMLLLSHGIATAVNVGKVVITKNPTSLNLVMIVRTTHLVWNVIKTELDINHRAIEKINMSVLKNKLETVQTLVLLDESIYYTQQIDRIIINMKHEMDRRNNDRNVNISKGFNELDDMIEQLKRLND